MCRCSSAFAVLPDFGGDPVHARHRAPVVALVEFPGPYLTYSQVSVLVTVDDGQNLGSLGCGECLAVVGDGPWFLGAQDGWLLVPVVGGAGPSDQDAGSTGGDLGGPEVGERAVQGVFGEGGVSVLSEMDSKST